MEPKGGDKPSNRKPSRGASCCRKQSSRQYERALPLAIPEIRPWGGVSKYKESAYGDVSSLPINSVALRTDRMRSSPDVNIVSGCYSAARSLANSLTQCPSSTLSPVSRRTSL